jgi:hypothetical protein
MHCLGICLKCENAYLEEYKDDISCDLSGNEILTKDSLNYKKPDTFKVPEDCPYELEHLLNKDVKENTRKMYPYFLSKTLLATLHEKIEHCDEWIKNEMHWRAKKVIPEKIAKVQEKLKEIMAIIKEN